MIAAHGSPGVGGEPFSSLRPQGNSQITGQPARIHIEQESRAMRSKVKDTAVQEPMGIVISRGSRVEPTPRFLAYVWGPAPEDEIVAPSPRAA
ncbi:MAG: hypothetical protein JWO05_604 [Gemmatimonadetes bacterium]|nr:hypothetical protein [Gemmatimonadota bacterium]